jgi:hypothetical protein
MSKNWIDPKIITGPPAGGSYYYSRDNIAGDIWTELKKGSSVLLSAPRRVGKTSVMQYMAKHPIKNYKLIFENIEGTNTAEEFYKRVYALLLTCLNNMNIAKKWFTKFVKSKSITKIGKDGVEFENKPSDFLAEIDILLKEINDNQEIENIILLLDELPEALFEINKANKNEDASSILSNLRRWRQQPEMNKKVKFVLAGSIGIHYVVEKIEKRNAGLNDLRTVHFEPLSYKEAHKYIDWATKYTTITYATEQRQHLLNKIQYFAPFFINLLLDEINKQAKKINDPKITMQSIDNSFNKVVKNNDFFEDWKNRLQNYMPKDDFTFVNEILIHIAHKGHITLQEIYDKAVAHNKTADYMDFIDNLEKDGYIVEDDGKYHFTSPFLSAFWKRNNPIYNF